MSSIGKVGDYFRLSDNFYGLVVASSADKFNLAVYPEEIWSSSDDGMFLMTNEIGLAQYTFDDECLCFISSHRSEMSENMSKSQIDEVLRKLIESNCSSSASSEQ